MNKILSILVGLFSLFFMSCEDSDKNFIKKVKYTKNQNGETVEQLIDNYIIAAEFLQKNKSIENNLSYITHKIEEANDCKIYGNPTKAKELSKILATYKITYPEIKHINWKIVSTSKTTKLLEVESDNTYLKLPIYKTKLNTMINFSNIKVYTTSHHPINIEILNATHEIVEFIVNENILE